MGTTMGTTIEGNSRKMIMELCQKRYFKYKEVADTDDTQLLPRLRAKFKMFLYNK